MFIEGKSVGQIDFHGLLIRDYTIGLETQSSFAVIEVPCGARHPLAWSTRSDKCYYVVSGHVRFISDEETRELGPGDVCVVSKGQRFRYENHSSESAQLALIHTPPFDITYEVLVLEE
jgi:mannose-6-phosphate isomerase-like protein (cupin superfamily)